MGLHTATGLNRWVESAEAKTLHASQLNIGPRLILGFVFIILSMLAADAVILWQFHLVRTQAERLNGIDQNLIAVLRAHTSLLAFHDRLEELADSQDLRRLLTEGGPLRTTALEDTRRAMSALSLLPSDLQRDPTILPTLHAVQSALSWQLEDITTLATSGDWRAVHLRLANQVRPLESVTSELVEKVDHEAGEEQAQTVRNIMRVQRLVFWVVPLTAIFTLLIAATLGLAITRSITQPLARLVEGSKALARGEFQHQVSVTGKDELAHLGHVFNNTAGRLQDLYATLQQSEDRLRLVIDTIPAHVWSARPDGSVDFINQRLLEFLGRSMEDILGWGWGSLVHPDDVTRVVGEWQAAVATGAPMESEARLRRMNGDYRWLLIRNVPLRDKLGNIVSWYGTAIDIEQRHRAEDALRQSKSYLVEAQRLSKTGSFGWCVSTGEIRWSEETFRIFQYDRAMKPSVELILERVHSEDVALVRQTIQRASQDGKDFEHEYRLVMPDGAVKHVHVVARPEKDESGETEFVGAVMDTTASKRAEEKLRRSEESLLEAQKLSHTGSWRHEVASGAVSVSPEIYRIHDIRPDDDPSNREFFFNKFHPEDRKRVVDLFERAEIEKTDFQVDYRIVLPDGTIKHLHTTGHPVSNESGDLLEFVGTAMDVTAAKQSEEALRRGEGYLAEAQRLTHTGSWAWNVATRQSVYWSQENYRLFGFDPEAGIPSDEVFYQRIHPEERDRVRREVFLERPDEGSHFDVEFRIVLPDGAIKYVRSTGHPVRNLSGDLLEYVGTSIDVTERKRGEQATRLLAAVVESSHDAIVSKDLDGIITSWNKGAERLFGYAAEEAVGQNITLIIPPDRRNEERAIVERLTRGERVDHFETVRMRKDGSLLDVALTISPMKDAAGCIVGASKLARDITERKRAEEALRQAQADLAYMSRVTTMGELTASLAHEIKQPISAALTNAKTCLRWLGRDVPDLPEASEAASRIVKDATRAADIISRISLLFKKGALQRELVDVNEVIREMIVLLRTEANRYSISIRIELAEDLPTVMADRVQLQQVFMNLMLNGIDAMKETTGEAELTIKSEADDGQVLVSVSDTGMGLPPEQVEQIFKAFFTTKDTGTGMGLPISRSIIESHGGRLWATGVPGRGATFQFTLPATMAAHA
jgi:PAS domain S-box-containing protein